mmetsp:Transcript_27100/g.23958  ORF Transcript_27100/g.23958 Transcript_27100/m.23958 type:complete len:161 (+) Transcript_27100:219-701(+)
MGKAKSPSPIKATPFEMNQQGKPVRRRTKKRVLSPQPFRVSQDLDLEKKFKIEKETKKDRKIYKFYKRLKNKTDNFNKRHQSHHTENQIRICSPKVKRVEIELTSEYDMNQAAKLKMMNNYTTKYIPNILKESQSSNQKTVEFYPQQKRDSTTLRNHFSS